MVWDTFCVWIWHCVEPWYWEHTCWHDRSLPPVVRCRDTDWWQCACGVCKFLVQQFFAKRAGSGCYDFRDCETLISGKETQSFFRFSRDCTHVAPMAQIAHCWRCRVPMFSVLPRQRRPAARRPDFCSRCEKYNTRATPIPRPRAVVGELYSDEPFENISIDFLSGMPVTARSNKHLVVICDHFTRWCDVFPVADMTAATVADVIVNKFIARFGCPRRIHSDNAANFSGTLLTEVCRLLGVEKSYSSTFHPEGNSKCERMMRTILSILSSTWTRTTTSGMFNYHSSCSGTDPKCIPHSDTRCTTWCSVGIQGCQLRCRFRLPPPLPKVPQFLSNCRNSLSVLGCRTKSRLRLRTDVTRAIIGSLIRSWLCTVSRKVTPCTCSGMWLSVASTGWECWVGKSVVVHHDRLKPRVDDPSVPVTTPGLSIPSSAVPDRPENVQRTLPVPHQSPTPRYAPLDGFSYLSPFRHSPPTNSDVAFPSPDVTDAAPDDGLRAAGIVPPVVDSSAAPDPAPRHSTTVTRPPDRSCP